MKLKKLKSILFNHQIQAAVFLFLFVLITISACIYRFSKASNHSHTVHLIILTTVICPEPDMSMLTQILYIIQDMIILTMTV